MLRQPFEDVLRKSNRILLAGCGGGYDIMGAVPLIDVLLREGKQVHLASLSFTYLNGLDGARQLDDVPNLYEVGASAAVSNKYCPEAWLSRWLEEKYGRAFPVWGFDKTGVRPLLAAYRHLVEKLGIDCIVLIDGGVDALCRGDETSIGTPQEDLTSIAAVAALGETVPRKLLGCIGLGAEMRDGICHEQIFSRIAELGRAGGGLGCVSLVQDTPPGRDYGDAVRFVFENQAGLRQSHIHRVVSASVRHEYGAEGPEIWISPLLSQFWFFELGAVARTHLFLERLRDTQTAWDVTLQVEAARHELAIRDRTRIPI
jgi:hypothetical protein